MRPDRPLIIAVASLATGVGLIVGYCQGATNMNLAYPLSGSIMHIDLTTSGPGVLGGLALIALGLLLTAWAVFAAFVNQISLLADRESRTHGILDREPDESDEGKHERYPGSILSERRHEG